MFKINLVPEVKQEQLKIKKLNVLVTSIVSGIVIFMVAVILIFSSYILVKKTQISRIEKDTTKVQEELKKYEGLEKTVLTLEGGLKEIKRILGNGQKWSKFFVELEKVTPEDTQVTSLSIKDNLITVQVVGRNVESIDRFVKSFSNYKVKDNNLFTNVKVNGFTEANNKVNFQATMNLNSGELW